jgi:cob(I)alamin adenosyltransferase
MGTTLYTRKGDDGSTGLLGEGRVMKTDARMEALGAIDEASATLGLARSLGQQTEVETLILQIQRELYQLMAEVAATPENAAKFRTIGAEQVAWLEAQADIKSVDLNLPNEFILPGDTPAGAAFSIARAVVRRAERRVVELWEKNLVENPHLIAYLNRLSSLCFVLEVGEVASTGKDTPSLAKKK